MADDRLAILILAGATLAALGGVALLIASSLRQAELVSRGARGGGGERWEGTMRALDSRFRRTAPGRALAARLANAGVDQPPLSFVLIALGIALAGYLIGRLLLPPLASVLLALGGLGAVANWVGRERERRRQAFIAQLPEVARILSNSASAGLSMPRAIEIATRELDDPAGEEMRRLSEQLRVGQSIDQALESLKRRMPSREVSVLMSTLVIQQRAGGDVVAALRDIAGTLEARKDLLREVRTVMAGSVFTSYLVAALGVGTIFMLDLISPGVIDEMLTSALGLAAFAIAATFYAVGFVLIRRITRVET